MATKITKITPEMQNFIMAALGKVDAENELQKISRKYSAKISNLESDMAKNHEKQRALAFRTDLPLEEMHRLAEELKTEHIAMYRKCEEIKEKRRDEKAPYVKESNAYTRAFCELDGLYDAYVMGIKNGTWNAVGGFKTEKTIKKSDGTKITKVTMHNVNNSFADLMVKLGQEHGMKFNNKSEIAFPESVCTRMGATVRKGELAALGKNAFVRLFCTCILQYAVENGQL